MLDLHTEEYMANQDAMTGRVSACSKTICSACLRRIFLIPTAVPVTNSNEIIEPEKCPFISK